MGAVNFHGRTCEGSLVLDGELLATTGSGQHEVQFARATRSPKCHRPMTKFELKPYCTLCPASRFLDIGPWESLPRFKFPVAQPNHQGMSVTWYSSCVLQHLYINTAAAILLLPRVLGKIMGIVSFRSRTFDKGSDRDSRIGGLMDQLHHF